MNILGFILAEITAQFSTGQILGGMAALAVAVIGALLNRVVKAHDNHINDIAKQFAVFKKDMYEKLSVLDRELTRLKALEEARGKKEG